MKVLIVDDQRSARHILTSMLGDDVEVIEAASLDAARLAIERDAFELAFVDVRLTEKSGDRDGIEVLRALRDRQPATPVVMLTAVSEVRDIRAAFRAGATDYVLKDDLCEEIIESIVLDVRSRRLLEVELLALRAKNAPPPTAFHGLIGASPPMVQLRAVIQKIALSNRPALIQGPSGAGKELVARAIHALGPHASSPLLDLNCGALPENLIESQLFGHERGAFTGADRKSAGYFALAGDGTLFLDEIAELPLPLQAKLLRVLETGRFRPIGSAVDSQFAGRVVVATHADLADRVKKGTFREDLFYRLDVLRVRLPSLEERRDDIPLLIAHFAAKQPRPLRFDPSAIRVLSSGAWPGNVRQLRNLIDRVAVLSDDDPITDRTLLALENLEARDQSVAELAREVLRLPAENKLALVEDALMNEALRLSGGNKSAAARLLGVHRKVIERRLRGEADE